MKATEGTIGRVFVIRLEDGDKVPDCLEEYAVDKGIKAAVVTIIGGIGEGSIITGPRHSEEMPPDPIITPVDEVHEVVGAGVIALDDKGQPKLHLHGSLGRNGQTYAGCLRPGVKTWLVGEVIICEILGVKSRRVFDQKSGFSLLEP